MALALPERMHILVGALVGAVIGVVGAVVASKIQGTPVTWQACLAGGIGGAVGGAITVASLGTAAPEGIAVGEAIFAFGAGGAAAGFTQRLTENGLEHRALGQGLLASTLGGLVGGAVAGFVLGPAVGPVSSGISRILGEESPVVARALLSQTAVGALAGVPAGAAGGAVQQATENLEAGRPVGTDLGRATLSGLETGAATGAAGGAVLGALARQPELPATEETPSGEEKPLAPRASGVAGVRPDLVPAVRRLFESGPSRWVDLGTQPTGDKLYQRGLSGDVLHPSKDSGIAEARTLLSGAADPEGRYVSPLDSLAQSDRVARETSSQYAAPLTIRGRVEQFSSGGPGTVGTIAPGNTIDTVDALGLFPDHSNPRGWAESYLKLCDGLVADGLELSPDSPGERFAADLRSALARGADDGELLRIIRPYESEAAPVETDAPAAPADPRLAAIRETIAQSDDLFAAMRSVGEYAKVWDETHPPPGTPEPGVLAADLYKRFIIDGHSSFVPSWMSMFTTDYLSEMKGPLTPTTTEVLEHLAAHGQDTDAVRAKALLPTPTPGLTGAIETTSKTGS
jgi:hypothetical protein